MSDIYNQHYTKDRQPLVKLLNMNAKWLNKRGGQTAGSKSEPQKVRREAGSRKIRLWDFDGNMLLDKTLSCHI